MGYPFSQTVGSAGATLVGDDGFKLVIVPNALTQNTLITVDKLRAPDITGYTEVTGCYEVRPIGQALEETCTVYLPYTYSGDKNDIYVFGGPDPTDPDPTGWHPTDQDTDLRGLIGGLITELEAFVGLVES